MPSLKKAVFVMGEFGVIILFPGSPVLAQNLVVETGTSISGSTEFGFDPSNLINAVTGTGDPDRCFTCVNTTSEAGGTTAGALTNSMFGEIRKNNDADLGKQSVRPQSQGMVVPTESSCGSNCNDSSTFTFSIPLPVMNFLNTGEVVSPTNPSVAEVVGKSGVKIEFSNNFEYFDDGTSTFSQTMKQTTFTGGLDLIDPEGTGNDVQIVEFEAHSTNPADTGLDDSGGILFWSQSMKEGGFDLVTEGSFLYDSSGFPEASAPTGAGQSFGDDNQEIGGGGGR